MPHYVKNKDLVREIVISKSQDELTTEAVRMLTLIAYGASNRLSDKREEDSEDCIAGGIEDLMKYWRGFNPDKGGNAFAYYTQMAKHGFAKAFKRLYPEYNDKDKDGNKIRVRVQHVPIDEDNGVYNL